MVRAGGRRFLGRTAGLLLVNVGTVVVIAFLVAKDSDSGFLGTFTYLLVLFNSVGWLLCAGVDRWSASSGRHRWWALGVAESLAFVWALFGIGEGTAAVAWVIGTVRLADYGLRLRYPPLARRAESASA